MTEFIPFPKIHRIKRACVITEKIDGTNAQIYIPENDGPMLAGSRNRWVTPDDDNFLLPSAPPSRTAPHGAEGEQICGVHP